MLLLLSTSTVSVAGALVGPAGEIMAPHAAAAAAPPLAEYEQATLQTRCGISEAVARQSESLSLAWKALTVQDVPLVIAVLPTAVDLVELDLRHNKLADRGVAALAVGLRGACKQLHTVRLARNGVTDRGIEALCAFLAEPRASASLTELDLSMNALRDDRKLGAALTTNTRLHHLDLSSNALRSGRALAAALGGANHSLRCANVLFNALDVGSAEALAGALRASRQDAARVAPLTLCSLAPDCESVLLPRRGLRSADVVLLAAELEALPRVRVVDLSYNALGPDAARALARSLRASSSLSELNLASNRLAGPRSDFGEEVGARDDSGVVALATALAEGNTLTSLNLSLNALGEAGTRAIAEAAASAPEADPLRTLHVGSGGEALPVQQLRGRAARGAPASAIGLGGRRLDDLDAVVIATLISANTMLGALDLSGSQLGAIGCTALARALRSPLCHLTQLDLSGKRMLSEEGKLAIGGALLGNTAARVGCLSCEAFQLGPLTSTLDLPGAILSHGDVSMLSGVLNHNHALLSLDLSHNGLGPPACATLCAAVCRNSALIELDLYGNEVRGKTDTHTHRRTPPSSPPPPPPPRPL